MGTSGDLWRPEGTYGDLWGPMETYEHLGDLWRLKGSMETYGDLWGPMETKGDQ